MREHVPGTLRADCIAQFAKVFGWTPGYVQWNGCCVKHGFKARRCASWFNKGNVPHCKGKKWEEWMPEESAKKSAETFFHPAKAIGSTYASCHCIYVKLSDEEFDEWVGVGGTVGTYKCGHYVPQGRFVWWKTTGHMPTTDEIIVHRDNDFTNNDFANLDMLARDVYHRAQNMGWTAETYESVKALAEVDTLINQIGNDCPCCGQHFEADFKGQIYCRECIDSGRYYEHVGQRISKGRRHATR